MFDRAQENMKAKEIVVKCTFRDSAVEEDSPYEPHRLVHTYSSFGLLSPHSGQIMSCLNWKNNQSLKIVFKKNSVKNTHTTNLIKSFKGRVLVQPIDENSHSNNGDKECKPERRLQWLQERLHRGSPRTLQGSLIPVLIWSWFRRLNQPPFPRFWFRDKARAQRSPRIAPFQGWWKWRRWPCLLAAQP